MSLSTTFLRLVSGERVKKYMRLEMAPERAFKYGPGYKYVEIPALSVGPGPGSQVAIQAACSIDLVGDTGYTYIVEPNYNLARYCSVSGMQFMHGGEGKKVPSIYLGGISESDLSLLLGLTKSKAKDALKALPEDQNWAIRLYMIG